MRPFMPNPSEWAPVIAEKKRELRAAEDAYVEKYAWPVPDFADRRAVTAAIVKDARDYEAEGSTGDDVQDEDLQKVLDAHAALKRAERDARQGRLFPEGPSVDRFPDPIVDLRQVERANASLERAETAYRESRAERALAAERRLREERHRRESAERAMDLAMRYEVMQRKSWRDPEISWAGATRSREEWFLALVESAPLREALEEQALKAKALKEAEWLAKAKEREAEARREKAAAAKRPLPKGYTIEKGRGGYQVVAPGGAVVVTRIATKGRAVTLAIEHASFRRGR